MPSGITHYRHHNRFYLPVLALSVAACFYQWQLGLGIALGYLLGNYIDPDLDLIGMTSSRGRMMRDFKLVGVFFAAWWMPYSYIMRSLGADHRSFATHFPVVSTVIRMFWATWPIALALWYYKVLPNPEALLYPFLGVLVGLSISDFIHFAADMFIVEERNRR